MSVTRAVLIGALVLFQACVSTSTTPEHKPTSQEAAVANVNLGAGYLRQGKPQLAIGVLQRAIKQDPKLADAHSTIAIAYDQLGSLDDAEAHYKKATQLEPDNSNSANAYAVFLCRRNRWKDAEPYFQKAVSNVKYETPEVSYTNAGVCALSAGDRDKAEQNFRSALTRSPAYADALEGMLQMSYQDKNYMQARAFLARYRDVKPVNAQVLWMCFNIEDQLKNHDAANRCAVQLREGFPDSPELEQLNQVQKRNGRG